MNIGNTLALLSLGTIALATYGLFSDGRGGNRLQAKNYGYSIAEIARKPNSFIYCADRDGRFSITILLQETNSVLPDRAAILVDRWTVWESRRQSFRIDCR